MIYKIILVHLFVICVLIYNIEAKVLAPEDIRDLDDIRIPGGSKRPCPLCDSSVYGYCSDKLFHDSCCCSNPYDPLPHQCKYADCSFLHANSCYEHRLITRCCCTQYLFLKK